jgi:hypothetical protein
MSGPRSLVGRLAQAFTDVIDEVDAAIGENRTYGAGIGPHDEDDQIDALVQAVRDEGLFDGTIATAKGDTAGVRYPGGQAADLYLEADGQAEYCEAKLFRFQKANGNPTPRSSARSSTPFRTGTPGRSSTT